MRDKLGCSMRGMHHEASPFELLDVGAAMGHGQLLVVV